MAKFQCPTEPNEFLQKNKKLLQMMHHSFEIKISVTEVQSYDHLNPHWEKCLLCCSQEQACPLKSQMARSQLICTVSLEGLLTQIDSLSIGQKILRAIPYSSTVVDSNRARFSFASAFHRIPRY